MKKTSLKISGLALCAAAFALMNAQTLAQTTIPGAYALGAGAADTSKPGFLVRTYQSSGQPNDNDWTEDQLAGKHGDNTADTSSFTTKVFGNSYLDETGVINYWDSGGEGVFPNGGTQNV